MWRSISLRFRIYVLLGAIVFITLMGGLVLVWYTYRMEGLLITITKKNLAALHAAETLETTLINQKGFVSYYLIDGDPNWLGQLARYRQIFQDHLNEVRSLIDSNSQQKAVQQLANEYNLYTTEEDRVIELYKADKLKRSAELHKTVRDHFSSVLDLCQKLKNIHQKKIMQATAESHGQAAKLRVIASVAMFIEIGRAHV